MNLSRGASFDLEFRAVQHMILTAPVRDLDRPDPIAELGTALQRPAAFESIEQGGAKGIAATGRIEYLARRDAGDVGAGSLLPDVAALSAERDDHALKVRSRQRLERASHPFAQHSRLIVVEGNPACLIDESSQFGPVEHRQALTGIEDERDADSCHLLGVLLHRLAAVRRNNPEADVARWRN